MKWLPLVSTLAVLALFAGRNLTHPVEIAEAVVVCTSQVPTNSCDYVSDGVADDAEIQAAINSVGSGGQVHLSAGTFNISTTLVLPSRVMLTGEGAGITILRLAPGTNVNVLTNADHENGNTFLTVRDLTIDGNRAAQNGDRGKRGIFFVRVSQGAVQNVEVRDVDGEGIRISGRGTVTRAFQLENIDTHHNSSHGLMVLWAMRFFTYDNILARTNGGHGVVIDHSEFIASNIQSSSNAQYGIFLRNFFSASVDTISATGNGLHGIYVVNMVSSTGSNWRAQNNGVRNPNVYSDLYFDNDVMQTPSYGVTRNISIVGVLVGSSATAPAPTEAYGMYLADQVNTDIALNSVRYGATLTAPLRLPVSTDNVVVN